MRFSTTRFTFNLSWLASLSVMPPAYAHVAEPAALQSAGWTFEPWVSFCLGLSLVLYVAGARRLAGRTRKVPALVRQSGYFALGWLTLLMALASPLDAMGNLLFSAHMVQHELLMIVAAPLLVMSRPFGVWLWALPTAVRHVMGRLTHHPSINLPWSLLSMPMIAWAMHALTLWLWHVPAFFNVALVNDTIHTWQHFSFLITALFFWWAVLDQRANMNHSGTAMMYLFTTMLHTGALGALMTFSSAAWYSAYQPTGMAYGLSPLQDQQLGGLIMWIPGGLAYLVAGLALGARWLKPAMLPSASAESCRQ